VNQNLSDFQNLFSQMVIGRPAMAEDAIHNDTKNFSLIKSVIEGQRPLFEKRFAIYRNNVHYSLIQALADTFPVVKQLVGDAFFSMMAKEYLHASPPRSAVLLEFGGGFASFVQSFTPAKSLPYLSDVANLEYTWQQAYHSEDAQNVGAEYFAKISAETLYAQSLVCHPSLELVHSNFAIGSIWQSHQTNDEGSEEDFYADLEIDVPQWLVVVRPEYDVQVCFMDEPGFRFVEKLYQGAVLGLVITELSELFPEWDIGQALAFAIQSGFFVGSEARLET